MPLFRLDLFSLSAMGLAGIVALPIGVIVYSVFRPEREILQHLAETVLPELLLNTLYLSSGVLVCTAMLGVGLGCLTGACTFPGRSFFSWALVLPMAIPAYVMAFIFIGVMDFTGPIQTTMRSIPGLEHSMFEVRSTPFVIAVISMSLYPYVYLLSRSAFLSQGRALSEAARTLGVGNRGFFWKVALPVARPWIVSGLALVLMETLADFGAVSIFNFNTLTTAIYKAWFGFFSLQAAAQLSSILVLFALVLLGVEAVYKSKMRYYSNVTTGDDHDGIALKGWKSVAACAFCSVVFGITFVLPVVQLLYWVIEAGLNRELPSYLSHSRQTLFLGIGAAFLICSCAVLLSHIKRRSPGPVNTLLCKVSTVGYALPGTVLAVGIFLPVVWLDNAIQGAALFLFNIEVTTVFQGTVLVMFVAYLVRFLAAGFGAVDSAMQGIPPSLDEASRIMGIKGLRLIFSVHLPLLKRGLLTALILSMIDVIKEMPITLMTRPFGWDTLAVKIYELTSEGAMGKGRTAGTLFGYGVSHTCHFSCSTHGEKQMNSPALISVVNASKFFGTNQVANDISFR